MASELTGWSVVDGNGEFLLEEMYGGGERCGVPIFARAEDARPVGPACRVVPVKVIVLDEHTHAMTVMKYGLRGKEIAQGLSEFLGDVRAGTQKRMKKVEIRRLYATMVFSYWMAKLNHPTAIFDKKREKRIMARLEECEDNVSEMLYVIDGAQRDPWISGRDEKANRAYDGIETIFRDRSQVERLAAMVPAYRKGAIHPQIAKYKGELDGLRGTDD